MAQKILEFQNFCYTYPLQKKPVLNDVTFDLNQGEFCLLLGRSGCGKSTLALAINRIIPTMLAGKCEGSILVDGIDIKDKEVKDMSKIVSIVFQDPDRQLCNIEVKNEVAFGCENLLFEPDEIKERVKNSLEFIGLQGYDLKNVWDLSGGEKQRLAIASALALNPKILILDEPTSNLDPVGRKEIFQTIKKIRERINCTILIVEHNLDELMPEIDRVLVMDEGSIIYNSTPQKLLDEKGSYMMNELGLWLPQVSIIGLKAKEEKHNIPYIPQTLNQALEIFKDNIRYEKSAEKIREKNDVILCVQDLYHTYPDGTQALNGVNLEINKGDMVAIVGKNGSGKSTLALHFVGILKPTTGKVYVDGIDTTTASIPELVNKVTYVFQYPQHQFIEFSVFDEVAYSVKELPQNEIEKRVNDMLLSLGLLDHREKHPTMLSMGQMRRLSVGAMLITQPDLVILDEPTFGQDRYNARMLMDYMRELNKSGKTVIFITHDMKLVAEYAEKLILMNEGTKYYEGDPREVFSNEEVIKACSLAPPPVIQLSNQLIQTPILTELEFCKLIKEMNYNG
jgi:energy-coupling factor transport system ATP-binding protein